MKPSPVRATFRCLALLLFASLAAVPLCLGQTPTPVTVSDATPAPDASPAEEGPKLNLRSGKITLQDGLATLNVPAEFRYLDKEDTRTVLVDEWGNPPGAADDQLGMIVPADFKPEAKEAYGVIISYDGNGYVKDDEASKMDYNKLLRQMKESTKESNAQRAKGGYPAVELVGWATTPHYDSAAKKLYWAKQLRFGGSKDHDTLNYDVRILGRRGVLVLQAVANMDQLEQIRTATPQILSMINYNEGHRYADFNPKTDKVAAYGFAALVAGGIAAKAGFFKVLIGGIIALKKFLVIGVVAVVGFFKRLFGGGNKDSQP